MKAIAINKIVQSSYTCPIGEECASCEQAMLYYACDRFDRIRANLRECEACGSLLARSDAAWCCENYDCEKFALTQSGTYIGDSVFIDIRTREGMVYTATPEEALG